MSELEDLANKDWMDRTLIEDCIVIASRSAYATAMDAAYSLSKFDKNYLDTIKANVELAKLNADLQEKIEQIKYHLKQIQWNGESGGWLACPSCHKLKKDGHSKDCELAKMAGLSE